MPPPKTLLTKEDDPSLKDRLARLLQPFDITSGVDLRVLMVHSGAVISGSAVLALLFPQQFTPNDLDFYVLPFGFPDVLRYVEQHTYVVTPFEGVSKGYNKSLVVVKLVHPVSRKSINIVSGFEDHVANIIARFHSTLVMNYISWFGVVVFYPQWTLNKCGLVVTDNLATRTCFDKYMQRGYSLQRAIRDLPSTAQGHICGEDPYCSETRRSLFDGHSLVEAFDPEDFDFEREETNTSWTLPILCSDCLGDGLAITTTTE